MKNILNKVLYSVLFKIGFMKARIAGLPMWLWWEYQKFKYGGKENIPQEIKDKHLNYHVSRMDLSKEAVLEMEFLSKVCELLNVYGLMMNETRITFHYGMLKHRGVYPPEEYVTKLNTIFESKYPMKALHDELLAEGAIRQQQVDFKLSSSPVLQELLNWEP